MRPLYVGVVVGLLGVLVVAGASSGFTAVYSDRAVDAQTVPDDEGFLAMEGVPVDAEPEPTVDAPPFAPGTQGGGGAQPFCEITLTNNFGQQVNVSIERGQGTIHSETLDPGESATFEVHGRAPFDVIADGDHVDFEAERRTGKDCKIEPKNGG